MFSEWVTPLTDTLTQILANISWGHKRNCKKIKDRWWRWWWWWWWWYLFFHSTVKPWNTPSTTNCPPIFHKTTSLAQNQSGFRTAHPWDDPSHGDWITRCRQSLVPLISPRCGRKIWFSLIILPSYDRRSYVSCTDANVWIRIAEVSLTYFTS